MRATDSVTGLVWSSAGAVAARDWGVDASSIAKNRRIESDEQRLRKLLHSPLKGLSLLRMRSMTRGAALFLS